MNNGPSVTIELSCFDCQHCVSHRGTTAVVCGHPATGKTEPAYIGDSNWRTPAWCPLRQAAIDTAILSLMEPGA